MDRVRECERCGKTTRPVTRKGGRDHTHPCLVCGYGAPAPRQSNPAGRYAAKAAAKGMTQLDLTSSPGTPAAPTLP